MKTNLVRFHTKDDLRLDGLLFEPDVKANKIVIQVHGTGGNFYSQRIIDVFAEELAKIGYSFLTFNNRGSGTEMNMCKETQDGEITGRIMVGSRNEIFEECLFDIQGAIDFATSKGYKEIILSGHSYGCNKIVYYALEKDFKGKIILLAPCDIAGTQSEFGANKANDMANFDFFRYRDMKSFNPLLSTLNNDIIIQIGTNDQYIAQENKQDCLAYLKKAFKGAKLTEYLIENANHSYDGKYQEVVNNIVNWLD